MLAKGELLAIYPEGTRSPDGRLCKGKVGVAVMARAAQLPVISCAVAWHVRLDMAKRINLLPVPVPSPRRAALSASDGRSR
ncbi:hypothetical protein TNCT6_70300 [Streptomyces sp. 6-11-2]|nr:hypothetical protein TNCT6_70300 [Streptomyces sp. 6-11-2]